LFRSSKIIHDTRVLINHTDPNFQAKLPMLAFPETICRHFSLSVHQASRPPARRVPVSSRLTTGSGAGGRAGGREGGRPERLTDWGGGKKVVERSCLGEQGRKGRQRFTKNQPACTIYVGCVRVYVRTLSRTEKKRPILMRVAIMF
jgi:hypothetical protein